MEDERQKIFNKNLKIGFSYFRDWTYNSTYGNITFEWINGEIKFIITQKKELGENILKKNLTNHKR